MEKKLYIGIDLGGTNVAAGLVDAEGKILDKVSIPTNAEQGVNAVIEGIHNVCDLLQEKTGFDRDALKAIGIGVPGMMNPNTGIVIFCPNLPIENVDISSALSKKWGVPVYLNNDANCAALGEAFAGGGRIRTMPSSLLWGPVKRRDNRQEIYQALTELREKLAI